MPSNNIDILSGYNYYLKVERGLSPNTVKAYTADIEGFYEFLRHRGVTLRDASSSDISDYIISVSDYLSKRSQARLLSSLNSFFDYLVSEGERKDNPSSAVDSPKLGKYLPVVLSVEEVRAILKAAPNERDRAILEVLYGCGLRVSEVCSLKISEVYLKDMFVKVMGKGSKERLVPMAPSTASAIMDYLSVRGCVVPESFRQGPESCRSVQDGKVRRSGGWSGQKSLSPHFQAFICHASCRKWGRP